MKSLDEIGEELSRAFDLYRDDLIDRTKADTLFNGGGKLIKIHQIKFAKEVFAATKGKPLPLIGQEQTE